MRVLVCGDRYWKDKFIIERELRKLPDGSVIIHGGARGADRITGDIGKKMGFKVIEFRAEWDKYGKAAGPIRNQLMIDEGNPDMVLAFHSSIERSKGTKDMVKRALNAGLEVKIVSE